MFSKKRASFLEQMHVEQAKSLPWLTGAIPEGRLVPSITVLFITLSQLMQILVPGKTAAQCYKNTGRQMLLWCELCDTRNLLA